VRLVRPRSDHRAHYRLADGFPDRREELVNSEHRVNSSGVDRKRPEAPIQTWQSGTDALDAGPVLRPQCLRRGLASTGVTAWGRFPSSGDDL
jgi:hypothetical protein